MFSRSTCERSTSRSVATPAARRFCAISRCFSFWRPTSRPPAPSPGQQVVVVGADRARGRPPAASRCSAPAPSVAARRAARMASPSLKLQSGLPDLGARRRRGSRRRAQALAQLGRERVEAAAVEQARDRGSAARRRPRSSRAARPPCASVALALAERDVLDGSCAPRGLHREGARDRLARARAARRCGRGRGGSGERRASRARRVVHAVTVGTSPRGWCRRARRRARR